MEKALTIQNSFLRNNGFLPNHPISRPPSHGLHDDSKRQIDIKVRARSVMRRKLSFTRDMFPDTVNAGGGEVALKKGPWTKEEDGILKEHIKKHGEGNWNAVQKESGLARCGKSCRLRWSNHLRPGVKKGSFTAEEERLISEFHFLKGSKWAHMASLLPGRTYNEIKNFWHTKSKKRKRAGLPIYPDEITSKYSLNGSQESADTLANESSQHDETKTFNMDITDLDLKYYKFRLDMLPSFFDSQDYKPIGDLVRPCSYSSHNTLYMPSVVVRQLFSSRSAAVPEVFDQYGQYPMLSTPCDPILNTHLLHGYDNPITGIHAASNISLSEPIYGSMSLELPSFQNSQTQPCTWSDDMYMSPLPSFEYVDTPVQAPPIEFCPSVPDSSDCGYLIDPIEYYNSDQNLNGTNIDSLQANTDSMAPNEADISTQWNGLDYDGWYSFDNLNITPNEADISTQWNGLDYDGWYSFDNLNIT